MRQARQLHQLFERLLASDDVAGRGRAFEQLLNGRLLLDGFSVHPNPKAAKPRQTDLVAVSNSQHFLIEAKWRKRKVDVADIGNLRDRLRRTPQDFIGCIFNMSDFTAGAIEEVESDRTREILLFSPAEVNSVFSDRVTIQELVTRKREALRIDGTVLFADPESDCAPATHRFPEPHRQLRMGEGTVPLVSFPSDNDDTTFFLEIPEIGSFETFASMTLRLDIYTANELANLLAVIENTVGLSENGCFRIQQLSHAWYGFGVNDFLEAIGNSEERYAEAKLRSPHHSEDLHYVDLAGSTLISLSSRQRVGDSTFLHGSELEIQLAGIPVDLSNLEELAKRTGNPQALIETISRSGLHSTHFRAGNVKLVPVQRMTTIDHGQEWVSGIVAKNPFSVSRMRRLGSQLGDFFPRHLAKPKYLLCAMDQWHPIHDEVSNLSVSSIFGIWIGHAPVLNVRCTWQDYIQRSSPKSDTEALLRGIPNNIGEEDRDVNRAVEALLNRIQPNPAGLKNAKPR